MTAPYWPPRLSGPWSPPILSCKTKTSWTPGPEASTEPAVAGTRSVTQNLADVAAMGARPVSLFVSLSLPGETPYGWVEDFARGLVDGVHACGAEDCAIAGGDMGASSEISVTVTALGRN